MDNVHRKFAHNLWWHRKIKYHLTQEQLALCLGCSRTQVSEWERGKVLPNREHEAGLREVFGDTALLDVAALRRYEETRR